MSTTRSRAEIDRERVVYSDDTQTQTQQNLAYSSRFTDLSADQRTHTNYARNEQGFTINMGGDEVVGQDFAGYNSHSHSGTRTQSFAQSTDGFKVHEIQIGQSKTNPVTKFVKNITKSAAQDQRSTVSNRTKLLLVTYLVTAILLAAIVVGTGFAVSGASARVASLEADLSANMLVLNEQAEQIAQFNTDEFITQLAQEFGMTQSENPLSLNLTPTVEAQQIDSPSNWFDQLTRFFSRIFS
ncbi:MAG: hypothetical protein FWD86_02190 [Firmicutes bacterium]|nr:hypothetical protein [Bacillota bacterium]